MSTEFILFLLLLCVKRSLFFDVPVPGSCGLNNPPMDKIHEGLAAIETYPWLGRLYYPIENYKVSTIVVLITKEMVISSAFEIDKYPKNDFRTRAKVVLGSNCSGQQIGVKDYTYHPDYQERTLSAPAIILLDLTNVEIDLHPICVPPPTIATPEFYTMSLERDCDKNSVKIYKMSYVDPKECKFFYKMFELDVGSMWPTHTACARALSGGKCVWRNGAVLMLRQNGRWSLEGIGVYGPGCETPARFLDYRMYHAWVRSTITNIGTPAITRMGPDQIIVRRSMSSIQRFGTCDKEETKSEIYTDETAMDPTVHHGTASYNLTLFTDMDYTCILLRVTDAGVPATQPRISLRRWCLTPTLTCYEPYSLQIDFHVTLELASIVKFQIYAYGRRARFIDKKGLLRYVNQKRDFLDPYQGHLDYKEWANLI